MKLLYIFDDTIKPLTMTDQGYCKPTHKDGPRNPFRDQVWRRATNVIFGRNQII
jgi:hypothetical protein